MAELEERLVVGDYVEKASGYPFTGTVVSAFDTLAGKRRVVVDNGDGMLHIFNEGQMRLATRSQSERVSRLEEALDACMSAFNGFENWRAQHTGEIIVPADEVITLDRLGERVALAQRMAIKAVAND